MAWSIKYIVKSCRAVLYRKGKGEVNKINLAVCLPGGCDARNSPVICIYVHAQKEIILISAITTGYLIDDIG